MTLAAHFHGQTQWVRHRAGVSANCG